VRRYGLRYDQCLRIEHLLAGPSRPCRTQQRDGQSAFCRGGDLEVPLGGAMARSARAFRRLEEDSHAVLALGAERRLGESFQDVGGVY
jgi:hypothetical protein